MLFRRGRLHRERHRRDVGPRPPADLRQVVDERIDVFQHLGRSGRDPPPGTARRSAGRISRPGRRRLSRPRQRLPRMPCSAAKSATSFKSRCAAMRSMSDVPARSIPAWFVMSPMRLPRICEGTSERNTSMPGRTGAVDPEPCCASTDAHVMMSTRRTIKNPPRRIGMLSGSAMWPIWIGPRYLPIAHSTPLTRRRRNSAFLKSSGCPRDV